MFTTMERTIMDHTSRRMNALTVSRRNAVLAIGMAPASVSAFHQTSGAQSDATPGASTELTQWIWSGAVTETSAVVSAALQKGVSDARLLVSDTEDFDSPGEIHATREPSTNNEDILLFEIENLQPDTAYWYALTANGEVESERSGQFRTFPAGPASFTFIFSACADTGSNAWVFETIQKSHPLFYLITGDFFYADIEENDPRLFRDAFDEVHSSPRQSSLYRSTPIAYVWDDHDFGPNNSDGTSRSREAAQTSYRDIVPHYPLATDGEDGPIYQSFSVGRVRFIMTDNFSFRTPQGEEDGEDKTMLGNEQKDWLKQELLDANGTYPVIFWINSQPWIAAKGNDADGWGRYATEREEIATFIADNEIKGLSMLCGDAHMLAVDDGSNNDYAENGGASFPVFHAAALDRSGSVKGGPYSEGTDPGGGHFGLVRIHDDGGNEIEVIWSGRDEDNEEVIGYRFTVEALQS
jgi:phosphodiesterase/alkaline phosphatase D-like protein